MNLHMSWLTVGTLMLATTASVSASPIDMLNQIAPQTTHLASFEARNVESQPPSAKPALSRRYYHHDSDDDNSSDTKTLVIGLTVPIAVVFIAIAIIKACSSNRAENRKAAAAARGGRPLNSCTQRTNINQPRRPPQTTLPPYTPGNTTTRSAPPDPVRIMHAAHAVPAGPGQTTTSTAPPIVPMIRVPAPSYSPATTRPETPVDTASTPPPSTPTTSTTALLPTTTSSPRPSSDTASTAPLHTTTSATTSRTTTRTAPPPPPPRPGTPPPPYSRDPV